MWRRISAALNRWLTHAHGLTNSASTFVGQQRKKAPNCCAVLCTTTGRANVIVYKSLTVTFYCSENKFCSIGLVGLKVILKILQQLHNIETKLWLDTQTHKLNVYDFIATADRVTQQRDHWATTVWAWIKPFVRLMTQFTVTATAAYFKQYCNSKTLSFPITEQKTAVKPWYKISL